MPAGSTSSVRLSILYKTTLLILAGSETILISSPC